MTSTLDLRRWRTRVRWIRWALKGQRSKCFVLLCMVILVQMAVIMRLLLGDRTASKGSDVGRAVEQCRLLKVREKAWLAQNKTWDWISNDLHYRDTEDSGCPVGKCGMLGDKDIQETLQTAQEILNREYNGINNVWNLSDIMRHGAYLRITGSLGKQFKLNGLVTVPGSPDGLRRTVPASVWISRGFTPDSCSVHVEYPVPDDDMPVYIIVPYVGRRKQLGLFLKNMADLKDVQARFKVILATIGNIEMQVIKDLIKEVDGLSEGDLKESDVEVLSVGTDANGKFSRAVSLRDAVGLIPENALMAFIDVDVTVQPAFFTNCRYNARQGHRVYYPIMYSLYPYGTRVDAEQGYFRKGSYGMMCGYKNDFLAVSGFANAEHEFSGWGWEDVSLYQKFQQSEHVEVFRAVEPNLLHRWHPKHCSFNRFLYPCLGTILKNMGSPRFLASVIVKANIDVSKIHYVPAQEVSNRNVTSAPLTNATASFRTTTGLSLSYEEAKALYEKQLENSGLLAKLAQDASAQGDVDI